MKQLSDFIKSKVSIDETDLQIILSKFNEQTVAKGKFVLKKGQVANQYFFIVSGGLRFSYGEYDIRDTSWVVFQNQFFTEMSSLMPQKPTRFHIEAIEETVLLYLSKAEMELLYRQFPVWQEFGRKTWEGLAVGMIDQIVSFQTLTAEERYLEFMKSPEIMQKVPVKNLASLLGITPNALSRIRKNIKHY
jgi:CRP-like cAMP-binding protein